jgi:hypothetical protein
MAYRGSDPKASNKVEILRYDQFPYDQQLRSPLA